MEREVRRQLPSLLVPDWDCWYGLRSTYCVSVLFIEKLCSLHTTSIELTINNVCLSYVSPCSIDRNPTTNCSIGIPNSLARTATTNVFFAGNTHARTTAGRRSPPLASFDVFACSKMACANAELAKHDFHGRHDNIFELN